VKIFQDISRKVFVKATSQTQLTSDWKDWHENYEIRVAGTEL